MAKAKAKAAVKRKPAKTQARAAATRAAKAPKKAAAKPAKPSVAKPVKPAAKMSAAKTSAAKTSVAKTSVAKMSVAKAAAGPTAVKPAKVLPAAAQRKTEQLTLPIPKPTEVPTKPVEAPAKPLSIVRRTHAASPRADLPPDAGFTLLVDGHFKRQFDDLKDAKAAASELKGRFPMLRVEIYDAARKARLPA